MTQLSQNEIKKVRGLYDQQVILMELAPYMSIGVQVVLSYIAIHPGCTMGEVIKATNYSQPSISRYIHDLSDAGRMKSSSERAKGLNLLDIKVNPFNLRERMLHLSPQGYSLMRELLKVRD